MHTRFYCRTGFCAGMLDLCSSSDYLREVLKLTLLSSLYNIDRMCCWITEKSFYANCRASSGGRWMKNNKQIRIIGLVRKPFILIALTTFAATAISIYCLYSDWFIIFQNLFYVPIVIACMYYTRKGFAFSVALSLFYFFLVISFSLDPGILLEALTRVLIFIGIAGVITFLSIKRNWAEEEKAKMEERIWLHKTESLGRMSGAVAHHFNNQLHVVLGYLDMVVEELPPGDPRAAKLETAMEAARKASDVSALLITCLGQKPVRLEVLDLSELCSVIMPVLRNGKPKDVSIETDFPSPGPRVSVDPMQIRQLLGNIVINAWEAIGGKPGTIRLNIKTVSPADIPTAHRFPVERQFQEQPYACLEVMDSGCGIHEDEIVKLFDPFYSTKFTGRGLGLSVVLGIVRSHQAVITMENGFDGGAVCSVFFPLSTQEVAIPAQKGGVRETKYVPGGTVLLVEDEDEVRKMTAHMLATMGFAVLEARDGIEAVDIFKKHKDDISCLLCDLAMPRMGGWETISALRAMRNDLPVVLASGYDESSVMNGEHAELPDFILTKPYNLHNLSDKIGHAIARKSIARQNENPVMK